MTYIYLGDDMTPFNPADPEVGIAALPEHVVLLRVLTCVGIHQWVSTCTRRRCELTWRVVVNNMITSRHMSPLGSPVYPGLPTPGVWKMGCSLTNSETMNHTSIDMREC